MPKSDSLFSQLFDFIEERPLSAIVSGGIGIILLFTIWKVIKALI